MSSWNIETSGSLSVSTVDRTAVEMLLHQTDTATTYLTIAMAAAGVAVTVVVTLFAGAKHPVPLYYMLTVAVVVSVVLVIAWRREWRHAQTLRRRILDGGFTCSVTPPIAAGRGPSPGPVTGYEAPELMTSPKDEIPPPGP